MGIETTGFTDLTSDLTALADELYASDSNYGKATRYVLQAGAQPILDKMIRNASTDPTPRTHMLVNSIRIGNVIKRRSGGWSVQIGVKRSEAGAAYSNPVEYSHAGPHPAPAHPFVRPAFDEGKEEAYGRMRAMLLQAIVARKK